LVLLLCAVSPSAVAAQADPASLHLRFRTIASHATWVQGNGRYIAYTDCRYGCTGRWRVVLLDDLTGKRTTIKP
jgi:hypothetical protein